MPVAHAARRKPASPTTGAPQPGAPRNSAGQGASPRVPWTYNDRNCEPDFYSSDVSLTPLDQVEAKQTAWEGYGRLRRGSVTIVAGEHDTGKSLLAVDWAARISYGEPWFINPAQANRPRAAPDGSPQQSYGNPSPNERPAEPHGHPGEAVIAHASDLTLDLLRRRIDAAGGEPERIASLALTWPEKDERFTFETIRSRTFSLCCAIRGTHNVRLLVIDNLEAWAGNCHEPPSAALLGFLLTQLTELATLADIAIVVLARLPRGGGQAAARKLDQLASLAPVVYLAATDPDRPSRKLLLPVKNSLAPPTAAAFEVVDGHLVWEREPAGDSAEEFIAPLSRRLEARHERQFAARWLLTALADGPLESRELFQQARDCGISTRTLRRAAGWLGLSPHKTSFNGPWQWQLGEPAPGTSRKPTQAHDEAAPKADEPAQKTGEPEASASELAGTAATAENTAADVSSPPTQKPSNGRAAASTRATSESPQNDREGGQPRARPIVRSGRLAPCGA